MAEDEEKLGLPTPFGRVELPGIREILPEFPPKPPEMDERRSKAMQHAVAIDVSSIIGWIPVVGDVVADVVEDLHGAELRKTLTKEEMDLYTKYDKVSPSTVALARAFIKTGVERIERGG